jgi:hypothetical protein
MNFKEIIYEFIMNISPPTAIYIYVFGGILPIFPSKTPPQQRTVVITPQKTAATETCRKFTKTKAAPSYNRATLIQTC